MLSFQSPVRVPRFHVSGRASDIMPNKLSDDELQLTLGMVTLQLAK
jgi:hypothetical protein